jgi:hypothetical protein
VTRARTAEPRTAAPRTAAAWTAAAALVTLLVGCTRSTPAEPAGEGTAPKAPSAATPAQTAATSSATQTAATGSASAGTTSGDADTSYRFPATDRLVAIGDLHGDLAVTRAALRLAHAIDEYDRWIGGKLVVVQTGDEIDRGDGDRAILDLFDRLADSAHAAGGEVHALIGNHEAMNVGGDFRYVTPGGFAAFSDVDARRIPVAIAAQFPVEARGRLAAFFPGGPYASRLSQRKPVIVVGDTLFVHGGVTLEHVKYGLGRFDHDVSRWMSGEGAAPALAGDQEGPLWTRRYSDDEAGIDCAGLGQTLQALGLRRMVVGHTPHESGVSPACDGRVWRIDTGLSKYYGGPLQVLEIKGDKATVLHGENGSP